MAEALPWDHVVVNDDLNQATTEMAAVAAKHRRTANPAALVTVLLPLRVLVSRLVGQAAQVVLWTLKGADACDRVRLVGHKELRAGKPPGQLEGLVPMAGKKPVVHVWAGLAMLPHTLRCIAAGRFVIVPIGGSESATCLGSMLQLWSLQCWLGVLIVCTVVGFIKHDPTISHRKPFQRFKASLLHFVMRWFGPFPIFVFLSNGSLEYTAMLSFLQSIVLGAHWVTKLAIKAFCKSMNFEQVDPSGHSRVCLNCILYMALLSGSASGPIMQFSASTYTAMQVGLCLMSLWTHHTLLDVLLGYVCALPQLLLMSGLYCVPAL